MLCNAECGVSPETPACAVRGLSPDYADSCTRSTASPRVSRKQLERRERRQVPLRACSHPHEGAPRAASARRARAEPSQREGRHATGVKPVAATPPRPWRRARQRRQGVPPPGHVAAAVTGDQRQTGSPSQTSTIDFTIWSSVHPIASAAAFALAASSSNCSIGPRRPPRAGRRRRARRARARRPSRGERLAAHAEGCRDRRPAGGSSL